MLVLASTVHDPEAGLKWLSDLHLGELFGLFDKIILSASPLTNREYLKELKKAGVDVNVLSVNKPGLVYFDAVKRAYKTNAITIFQCDFDRVLHWAHFFSSELNKAAKEALKHDYIVCERPPKEYKDHHEALYETVQLPSEIIAKRLGEKKFHDYLSGCFVLSKKAARIAVEHGGSVGFQFWGYWPVLMKEKSIKLDYLFFKGLGWETPDRFQKEVASAGGVEKWRENLSTPAEWKKRVKMARESVEEII